MVNTASVADPLLVTVTGPDHPGVTSGLFEVLDGLGARLLDLEQVVVRDRLLLGVLVASDRPDEQVRAALAARARHLGVEVTLRRVPEAEEVTVPRHHVTVLAQRLDAATVSRVARTLTGAGANIERIERLSAYPVTCYELLVAGGDPDRLRNELSLVAARAQVDVAVQPAGLYRRAKRLVVLDVDSTLVQGEVIEMLAERAGHGAAVAEVTASAMRGELDFAESLTRRVALLEGLDAAVLAEVAAGLRLTPGARTLVRTLKRLGYTVGVVSGGFTQVVDRLVDDLGLDFAAANLLEVADGRLTGRVSGPVVDRAGKAEALERFAAAAGVPLSQTVAVGDGANDLDMLSRAGLGIAFNAKPVVREAADTAVNVPYLDAILFLLGITRAEVEHADAEGAGG